MFDHDHHQKIHLVLNSLNPSIFEDCGLYFGGGTLITLIYNEYRWSKDIDFVAPVGECYKKIRKIINDSGSRPESLFRDITKLEFPRDVKADQYGIRFLVVADGTPIKFEIFAEARIELEPPAVFEGLPVPCLNIIDQYAEKLLANADRWNDSSIESRDLIDLAMLRVNLEIPQASIEKAEKAYPVLDPLKKALNRFQDSEKYRDKCFSALEVENIPLVIDGIDLLAEDFGIKETLRASGELHED